MVSCLFVFKPIEVLKTAIRINPQGAKAYYYLGNLFYDKLDFDEAVRLWEESEKLDGEYPTLLRNLALAYYNKKKDPARAQEKLEKAFALDSTDARVFLELDQLHKKLGYTARQRLEIYQAHLELIQERDDLYTEYVTVLNLAGENQKAFDAIMAHKFGAWEGAEGKITTQYKTALLELARAALKSQRFQEARQLIEKALSYPENLGEGRLEGTKDNHLYYTLGLALEGLGEREEARKNYQLATLGAVEPAGMMYYYDQPADMILYQGLAKEKLGSQKEANARYYKLLDYGENHVGDHVKMDYFAVSLPDFLILDEDLDRRNQAHCYYLMGLAHLGLRQCALAAEDFGRTLSLDQSHQNAAIYRRIALEGGI